MLSGSTVCRAGLWLAVLCGLGASPELQAAEKPQKLAIVNVSFVFEKYAKVADVERRIESKFKAQEEQLKEREQKLANRLDELKPKIDANSPSVEVFDEVQSLRREQFLYEQAAGKLLRERQEYYTKEMREVLSDIRGAIRQAAEKGVFDLVLRSPDSDDPQVAGALGKTPPNPADADKQTELQRVEPQTALELAERFNRNPVLFGAQTVDITPEVLNKLNADYAKRGSLGKNPAK